MRLLIAGHSHRIVLAHAQTLLAPNEKSVVQIHGEPKSYSTPDVQYWETARDESEWTGLVWGGNEHNTHFLIPQAPFVALGSRERVQPVESTLVSYSALLEFWDASMANLESHVKHFFADRPLVILGTPPPKPDAEVRQGMKPETFFAKRLAEYGFSVETAPITDEETRVALWESLQDRMRQTAGELGGRFIEVPVVVQTQSGALRPEFCCTKDATHANTDYGVVFLRHILSTLGLADE